MSVSNRATRPGSIDGGIVHVAAVRPNKIVSDPDPSECKHIVSPTDSLEHRSIGSHQTNEPMKTGWNTSNPVDATTFRREQRSILAHHWWTNLLYWCFTDQAAKKNVQWISWLGSTVSVE